MAADSPRPTMWRRLRARPRLSIGLTGLALCALAVVLVWFQPQALLFDTVVDEAFPVERPQDPSDPSDADARDVATEDDTTEDDTTEDDTTEADATEDDRTDDATENPPNDDGEAGVPSEPVALANGDFAGRSGYSVVGEATTYELGDGSRVLRLEEFESTNGPDLYVYLAAADRDESDAALDADAVNLGTLSGNVGSQNYDIPDDVDLDRYDTVVIWCLRFSVGFGAADLTAS